MYNLIMVIQYQRDRSSFAGAALKITNEKDVILVRQWEEKIIQDVSKLVVL